MTPIDPVRAELHARHAVAGDGSVVATSVVAVLLDELDRERSTVRELRNSQCARCRQRAQKAP